MVAVLQPGLVVPVVLVVLLIAAVALLAVCSRDPDQRAAAERILDRLLTTLRGSTP